VAATPVAGAENSSEPQRVVIATGLNNPRGLGFGPAGALYVAEAGSGGSGPCQTGPEGDKACFGSSGAVTRIKNGVQSRIITGLPSVADEGAGTAAIGPARVDTVGGKLFVLVGNPGGGTDTREFFDSPASSLGKLLRYNTTGHGIMRTVADMPPFEEAENPDGGAGAQPGNEIDSNPYGLFARLKTQIVADAGGNDLLKVDRRGHISVLATFPIQMVDAPPDFGLPPGTQIPVQSVPTSVTRGPDGAYYVGELTGFPFVPGLARVWRVLPGHAPEVFASGFTNIIDVKFDHQGRLHVLEIAKDGLMSAGDELPVGALIRVGADGSKQVLTTDLAAPGGLAFDSQDRAYVTNNSILPASGFPISGEVVRFRF
jgi:hypothetical protein